MNRLLFFGGAVAVLGAAAAMFLLFEREPNASGDDRRDADEYVVEAHARPTGHDRSVRRHAASADPHVDQLRDEVRQLRSDIDRRATAPPAEAQPEAAPSVQESRSDLDPEAIAAAERAWSDGYAAQLAETLAAQDVDHAWAAEAEDTVRTGFGDLVENSRLADLTCAATLCRLELVHGDAMGHEQLLSAAQDEFPWSGPGFITTDPDDDHTTIVFLSRPGTELPTPDTTAADHI